MQKKLLTLLVLLCLTVSGAWAQEVTLLTTIENTGDNASFTSGSKTFDNIATVTFSGTVYNDGDKWGWCTDEECTLTVTAAEGYTITRVKFYTDRGSAFDEDAPFEAILLFDDESGYVTKVNGTSIDPRGVTKIEVYGYETPAAPAGYTVSMPQDTPDAEKWTARAGTDGTYQQLPLEGVAAGTAVSVKYTGTKKVKSVKAVKKAAAAPAVTDLSMVDCAGTARSDGQWTANCYMVHTAGDYKLPLVYGNAIKSGADNTAAYTGVSRSNTTATFPRHDGQAITAPWIKDNGITVTQAELLWQDAQGLITAVGIDGDYLTLTVGMDADTQEGNAVIAAKDAGGTIVWSWHIWVTKQTFATLTDINTGSHTYSVTPVNLGWVGEATSTTGYNTFYQWGRKDAFIPSTGTGNTNHTVYDISNATVTGFSHTNDNSMTIGGNIQHPTVHYRNTSTSGPCDTQYYNMWDAQQTSNDIAAAATVKTVYDPCPPGFCVPTSGLYNYIKSQNKPTWNTGYTYPATNGVFFPASGYRNGSSGDLGSVGTLGYYWSATPYDGTRGRDFYFTSGSWSLSSNLRTMGCPVRAVAE